MSIGTLVKESRERFGWDQAELARRVGIGQQTISRWERGLSRPSAKMVEALALVFEQDLSRWLLASGFSSPQGITNSAPLVNSNLPVVSLLPHLPLQSLTPENFELFHVGLLQALYPSAEITREGSQGHTQYGVDISVRFTDGSRFVFQCKRVAAFGKAKVKQAILANQVVADQHFLCLSRIASPDARKEVSNHEGWHLWDCENISFKVRELDKDRAGRLIDTYFGGPVRAAFLGLATPGPWITTEEYFRPFENIDRTFTHGWSHVGHQIEIEKILQSILEEENPVIALSSPGGTGKTRLIKEIAGRLAEENPELSIRFASQGFDVSPTDYDAIPLGKTLLIIDDAHDRDDLSILLHLVAHVRSDVTLLFTTRPYHEQKIRLDAGTFGFEPSIQRITALTLDEHIQLSAEILRTHGGDESLATRIAEITKDSPLATSIGSSLVARRAIKPEFLANEKDFQRIILLRFKDALLGSIADTHGNEALRELICLIALLQPISLHHPEHQRSFESVLSRPWDVIHRQLSSLRDAGILVQRGTMLRIVPDLLADFIAADNCVDSNSGVPTGYADRVFTQISDEMISNLLVNLAKLDWRLSAGPIPARSLLTNIWNTIENRFVIGDNPTRTQYMLMAGNVGYFQPEQILRLAKLAIAQPARSQSEQEIQHSSGYANPELSKRALVRMLQSAAYGAGTNAILLNEICDLLWELGRGDARALNQTPEHPIRILNDLASISPGKPLEFNQLILANALTWLPGSCDDDAYSVFDVIGSVLATNGFETKSSKREITFQPYKVIPSIVAPLRKAVVDVAIQELSSTSLTRAMRSAKLLEDSIRGPIGLFDQVVTDEERDNWKPLIQEVLVRILTAINSTRMDPYVHVRILQSVRWYLKYSKDPDLNSLAREIGNSIEKDPKFLISQAFTDHWEMENVSGANGNSSIANPLRGLADSLIKQLEVNELTQLLLERLSVLQALPSLRHPDAGFLVGEIVELQPVVGIALIENVLADPTGPASQILSPALAALARNSADQALDLADRALRLNLRPLNLHVSFSYGWGLGQGRFLSDGELKMIETLSKFPDIGVRINALGAIRQIIQQDPDRALDLVLNCNLGESEKLAAEVLSNFGRQGTFRPDSIPATKLQNLLDQLSQLPTIEEFEIGRAIQSIGLIFPDMVMNFLLGRIRRNTFEDLSIYRAIPFMWESANLIDLRNAPNFQHYLRSIRDLTLDPELPSNNWSVDRDIVDLFALIAIDYSEPVLEILQEWVNSGDAQKVAQVGHLLRKASPNFVFDHFSFTETLLASAFAFGTETFKDVCSSLLVLATMGSKSGQFGQPYPRDLQQRQMALEIAARTSLGSPVRIFYDGLIDSANKNILRSTILDEMDEESY